MVANLVDMGFDRDAAIAALAASRNQVGAALASWATS